MSELAYLVIREGGKWSDVFRLIPGQAATIGRAPTNQIVLKDDRCSRIHVEVFFAGGQWVLRDLDSRNGTMIGSQRIVGDHLLKAGDIIRIPANKWHWAKNRGNETAVVIETHAGPATNEQIAANTVSLLGPDEDPASVHHIYNLHSGGYPGDQAAVEARAFREEGEG